MQVTLDIPDEMAAQLEAFKEQLPRILELGLREWNAARSGFEGINAVLETLANLPSPDQVLALHPSAALQERVSALLEKNRAEGLTSVEEREWQQYEYLEHLVRTAKAQAHLKKASSQEL